MSIEFPFTTKPEEIDKLLKKLITINIPQDKIDASFFKASGFPVKSGKQLYKLLKMLGFIDENDKASAVWKSYVSMDNRGAVLASAIQQTYADMFESMLCPYLEDDEVLLDYFKRSVTATPEELELILETFRVLSDMADFQDLLCQKSEPVPEAAGEPEHLLPDVKVNPDLQVNIQIHIDPHTSDEKIETIFKNMRKYLLGKED